MVLLALNILNGILLNIVYSVREGGKMENNVKGLSWAGIV